jgi:hypothetical protein
VYGLRVGEGESELTDELLMIDAPETKCGSAALIR